MKNNLFYSVLVSPPRKSSHFFYEYTILCKTIDTVNNFSNLYKNERKEKKGPTEDVVQDLHRAMLIFACAGLDVLVKSLIRTKLPELLETSSLAKETFVSTIKNGLNKKESSDLLSIVALALSDHNPRDILLQEYIEDLVGNSLQSVAQLKKISRALGIDIKLILAKDVERKIDESFKTRNEIIHEMDVINKNSDLSRNGKTRRQRHAQKMESQTKDILDFSQSIFLKVYENANLLISEE